MHSSFFGLNIATQGLYTARGGLDVTNHNIANADTDGYSRQKVLQKASRPLSPQTGNGMVGTGSEIVDIKRMRDYYLDTKYWSSNTSLGQYETMKARMSEFETLFEEPSDSGFNTAFNGFFDSLQDLTKNPGDDSYKTAVIQSANTFANYFNNVSSKMQKYQRDINFEVETKVKEINDTASQIQRLNKQIHILELNGSTANDLRDERDKLIDGLSKVVNVEAKEIKQANGHNHFQVKINGQTLVNHYDVRYLKVVSRDVKLNPEDVAGLYDIQWTYGQKFNIYDSDLNGELKAYIDLRDGNNKDNFQGQIESSSANTITIKNPNRVDMLQKGKFTLNKRVYEYDGFDYNSSTEQITLKNIVPNPVVADPTISTGDQVEMGNTNVYKGIPYYQHKLNEFVRTFAKEFNKIHKQGQLEDGTKGHAFFVPKDYDGAKMLDESNDDTYSQITAANFSISNDILQNEDNFANKYNKNNGESDNELIFDLLKIKKEDKAFNGSDPANYMQMMLADVGIDTSKAKGFYDNELNVTKTIENQRMSISGVDLNEETSNMIKYQHAYNVAAKMISVMNEIYDVTINKMGA